MILQTEKFQDSSKKILNAVDTDSALKNVASAYDTLELEASGKVLHLNATNGEYFVSISLPLDEEASIKAVVDAKLFLALISKITTKTVELTTTDSALVVKANGTYKFPLKYDVDSMIVLPRIEVNNPTSTFVVSGATLISVLNNNSREVNLNSTKQVQKLYHLDQEGCITFTNSSACVNSFNLNTTTKMLLTQKLVKLFKLFKDDDVNVTLGFEDVGGVAQMRVKFEQDNVVITSILTNDQALFSSVPVTAIRTRANKVFDYSVSFDKKAFLEAVDRLLLFDTTNSLNRGVGIFEFDETNVTIYDWRKANSEILPYVATVAYPDAYTCNLDLEAMRDIVSNLDAQVFTLNYGDNQAVVISSGNIKNVITQRVIR